MLHGVVVARVVGVGCVVSFVVSLVVSFVVILRRRPRAQRDGKEHAEQEEVDEHGNVGEEREPDELEL